MKKALSILLALSLLLCCVPALAEEAAEYTPYTDPTGHYSLEYPANFMHFDSNNVVNWVEAVTKAESEGITLPDWLYKFINMVLENEGLTVFTNEAVDTYIYVAFAVPGLTMDDEFTQSYLSQIKEHWRNTYPNIIIDDEGSVLSSVDGTELSHVGMYYLKSNGTLMNEVKRVEQCIAHVGNAFYDFQIFRTEGNNTEEITHMVSSFSATATAK